MNLQARKAQPCSRNILDGSLMCRRSLAEHANEMFSYHELQNSFTMFLQCTIM